jgi:hypothetical protein
MHVYSEPSPKLMSGTSSKITNDGLITRNQKSLKEAGNDSTHVNLCQCTHNAVHFVDRMVQHLWSLRLALMTLATMLASAASQTVFVAPQQPRLFGSRGGFWRTRETAFQPAVVTVPAGTCTSVPFDPCLFPGDDKSHAATFNNCFGSHWRTLNAAHAGGGVTTLLPAVSQPIIATPQQIVATTQPVITTQAQPVMAQPAVSKQPAQRTQLLAESTPVPESSEGLVPPPAQLMSSDVNDHDGAQSAAVATVTTTVKTQLTVG